MSELSATIKKKIVRCEHSIVHPPHRVNEKYIATKWNVLDLIKKDFAVSNITYEGTKLMSDSELYAIFKITTIDADLSSEYDKVWVAVQVSNNSSVIEL